MYMKKPSIKKICIIGIGRMGNALLSGYLNAGFSKENFSLVVRNEQQRNELIRNGFQCEIHLSKVTHADVVFIAVKPRMVESILEEIKKNQTLYLKPIISVCAGFTYKQFEKKLGSDYPIFRAYPNIFVNINKGNILFPENLSLKSQNLRIEKLLRPLGTIYKINEAQLSQFAWNSSPLCSVILSKLILENFNTLSPKDIPLTMEILLSGLDSFYTYIQHLSHKGTTPIQIFQQIYDQIVSPNGLNEDIIAFLENRKFFEHFVSAKNRYINQQKLLSESLEKPYQDIQAS